MRDDGSLHPSGCPIRKSVDRRSRAPPHGLSQLATSFIACPRLGIPRVPLPRLVRSSSSTRADPPRNTPIALVLLSRPTLSNSCRPAHEARAERCCSPGIGGSSGRPVSAFGPKTYSRLQKGGDPAAGSPTATLLRLRPSYRACLRPLPPCGWDTDFGHSRLPWRDGRCVQGPGTYSPRRS